MTKIDAHLERDFDGLDAAQQAALLLKLQRYIDRGRWAEAMHASLMARAHTPKGDHPQPKGDAAAAKGAAQAPKTGKTGHPCHVGPKK